MIGFAAVLRRSKTRRLLIFRPCEKRKEAESAAQQEIGDGLFEEENGRKGEEKEAEEAEERVFDDFSERPHGAPIS